MVHTIVSDVRQALADSADEKTKASSDRYHKPGDAPKVYGVRMGIVSKIARESFKEIQALSKQDVFALCEQLWQSAYLEEAVIACAWAESLNKQFEPADFRIFRHWVYDYLTNWGDCDTLCNHTIGDFIMMYPQFTGELKKWATSEKRLVRRAAAVTLIIPARRGLFLEDIFDIADILLTDKEDLVRKGYGWMLKAASEAHQEEVFNYVMSKKDIMPRTALRYAIEKMPPHLKAEAMKK